MQAQKEFSAQGECKDKFLVQYVFASPDVTEARAGELFENGRANNVRQAKLRVMLQGPAKPPSPVPEGIEEEMASPVKAQSPPGTNHILEHLGCMCLPCCAAYIFNRISDRNVAGECNVL